MTDIDTMGVRDLIALREKIDGKLHAHRQEMQANLSLLDKVGGKAPRRARTKAAATATAPAVKSPAKSTGKAGVAAKYKNPATGQTWSGRGQLPKWIRESGLPKEQFAITAKPRGRKPKAAATP